MEKHTFHLSRIKINSWLKYFVFETTSCHFECFVSMKSNPKINSTFFINHFSIFTSNRIFSFQRLTISSSIKKERKYSIKRMLLRTKTNFNSSKSYLAKQHFHLQFNRCENIHLFASVQIIQTTLEFLRIGLTRKNIALMQMKNLSLYCTVIVLTNRKDL